LKIEKKFSLSKLATTTKKKFKKLKIKNNFYFIFRVRADAGLRPHGRGFTASADGKNPFTGKTASAG
jgi:hypothetical protein